MAAIPAAIAVLRNNRGVRRQNMLRTVVRRQRRFVNLQMQLHTALRLLTYCVSVCVV